MSVEELEMCFWSREEVGDWLRDESRECEALTFKLGPLSSLDIEKREESRLAIVLSFCSLKVVVNGYCELEESSVSTHC